MNGGPESSVTLDSASPLELALDRAMDSYWAEERALYTQRCDQQHTPTNALAVRGNESALATLPTRLYWRGIEVSEEFQRYAARVARGEQLAPWRGQVLARPCPDFPCVQLAPAPRRPAPPLFGRSAKIGAMLLSAGTALLAAIGVGSGTASPVQDELDDAMPDHGGSALRPAPLEDDALTRLGASEVEPHAAGDIGRASARQATGRRQRSLSRRNAPITPHAIVSVPAAAAAGATLDGTQLASTVVEDDYARALATTPEEWVELAMAGAVSTDAAATGAVAATDPAATGSPATGAAASLAATNVPAAAVARSAVSAAPARRSVAKPAASRVGVPSDWDPTGKMSILFSDDMPF